MVLCRSIHKAAALRKTRPPRKIAGDVVFTHLTPVKRRLNDFVAGLGYLDILVAVIKTDSGLRNQSHRETPRDRFRCFRDSNCCMHRFPGKAWFCGS